MAVPPGTTSRQIGGIARWMFVALVITGMLLWWWPSYRSWGALSAGVLVVFGLWLLWRTATRDHRVPGHLLHWVLLVPAILLTVHFARSVLWDVPEEPAALAGAVDLSVLVQLGLLAVGVMLTQSFFPRAARNVIILSLCGAAMMSGSAAAMTWGQATEVRGALTLLGIGGVAVWLSPLWGVTNPEDPATIHLLKRSDLRIGCVGVGVIAAALFQRCSLSATVLAGLVVGIVLFLSGLVFPRRRKLTLIVGGVLAAGSTLAVIYLSAPLRLPPVLGRPDASRWIGSGEHALRDLSAADSGLTVLLGMVGLGGTIWIVGGMLVCMIWMMCRARRGSAGDQGRAIVWASATALTSCAMLCAGGLFIPSVTLAMAFTWGMLPRMLGKPARQRPGAMLLLPILLLMLLLAFARQGGMAAWSAAAFGLGDKCLHAATGVILAGTLAWLVGAKRCLLGVAAIALAALVGGAGELVQLVAGTGRAPELWDWAAHAIGCLIALGPYLLCVGARWCESTDATPQDAVESNAYTYGAK